MAYRLVIKPLAAMEAIEAFDYYESQRLGQGEIFFEELDACYDRILNLPTASSYANKPFRESKVDRFPYVVIYEIKEDDVIVYSVFNTYQDPSKKPPA